MDVLDLDRRAAVGVTELIAATTPDHYGAPTPCSGWRVRDLLAHLVSGNQKYAGIGAGGGWTRGAPEVDLGDDDPRLRYRASFDAMVAAWRGPGALDREIELPWGRDRAGTALFVHLGETLVHGWDLARATGQEPAFDDDVVEASLTQYAGWLPATRPPGVPFGDAAPVPADAPLIDRLAAFLGRDVAAWSR